jgi:hypothetical protein
MAPAQQSVKCHIEQYEKDRIDNQLDDTGSFGRVLRCRFFRSQIPVGSTSASPHIRNVYNALASHRRGLLFGVPLELLLHSGTLLAEPGFVASGAVEQLLGTDVHPYYPHTDG